MADVGAHERELAMEALDAHRRTGRLERDEHATRCASASTATSRSELDALFTDLPEPHPAYPGPPPGRDRAVAAGPVDAPAAPELPELVAPGGAAIARHAGLISLLTPAVAAVLFAVSGGRFPWIFILVPVVLAAVAWISHREGQ
ncbi:hypothetical protein Acsp06_56940 [Actinomycetospora sp. NBRC 106375]|uniref:DUF1707 SHOCT-like domain-containing protein n=1 Tax=Actinomycetospora sp. NBRC 106375 TaxID=3032207 RepID=UPI00249FD012|nr:DUF1707 domain-containing protein [Actinomycetospora sp. NBRC 106375]GLZ49509.1 hypothetical protein Acsp06_56940 [Actinomycetospora sp. NBRC 106375]